MRMKRIFKATVFLLVLAALSNAVAYSSVYAGAKAENVSFYEPSREFVAGIGQNTLNPWNESYRFANSSYSFGLEPDYRFYSSGEVIAAISLYNRHLEPQNFLLLFSSPDGEYAYAANVTAGKLETFKIAARVLPEKRRVLGNYEWRVRAYRVLNEAGEEKVQLIGFDRLEIAADVFGFFGLTGSDKAFGILLVALLVGGICWSIWTGKNEKLFTGKNLAICFAGFLLVFSVSMAWFSWSFADENGIPFGSIDAMGHTAHVQGLVRQTQGKPELEVKGLMFSGYEKYYIPLFHIFAAHLSLVTGAAPLTVTSIVSQLLMCFLFPLSIMLLAYQLSKSWAEAALAGAFFFFSSVFVFDAVQRAHWPMAYSLTMLALMLAALFKWGETGKNKWLALGGLFFLSSYFSHGLTSMMALLGLALFGATRLLGVDRKKLLAIAGAGLLVAVVVVAVKGPAYEGGYEALRSLSTGTAKIFSPAEWNALYDTAEKIFDYNVFGLALLGTAAVFATRKKRDWLVVAVLFAGTVAAAGLARIVQDEHYSSRALQPVMFFGAPLAAAAVMVVSRKAGELVSRIGRKKEEREKIAKCALGAGVVLALYYLAFCSGNGTTEFGWTQYNRLYSEGYEWQWVVKNMELDRPYKMILETKRQGRLEGVGAILNLDCRADCMELSQLLETNCIQLVEQASLKCPEYDLKQKLVEARKWDVERTGGKTKTLLLTTKPAGYELLNSRKGAYIDYYLYELE